jgi:hypothetical protein
MAAAARKKIALAAIRWADQEARRRGLGFGLSAALDAVRNTPMKGNGDLAVLDAIIAPFDQAIEAARQRSRSAQQRFDPQGEQELCSGLLQRLRMVFPRLVQPAGSVVRESINTERHVEAPQAEPQPKMSEQRRAQLLALTDDGRRVLAERKQQLQ